MTQAKTNDRKGLDSLPMESGVTYVVGRAYNDYSWYYQLTQQNSKFVGRMKKNTVYKVIKVQDIAPQDTSMILSDEIIRLDSKQAKKDCPTDLRRIVFKRDTDDKILIFGCFVELERGGG
ncbi:hypothetical protein MNBD_GAMMA04-2161 [hydrothermal vent metagenome]|uniref:Uncharacterized protein n=1 Tax=hydrothermal vent metagenome TaxID=652676 RepID=A0A3B0VVF7_9ZZZZ